MASHTNALRRRWARYGTCDTCEATYGQPCMRKTPAHQRYRAQPMLLAKAHRGRPRSKDTCGHDGGRQLRPGSTLACHLPPDHGDELHRNAFGERWRGRVVAV